MRVELSKPAQISLAHIIHEDETAGKSIIAQLKFRLPLDPYPDIDNPNDLFRSAPFKNLQKLGYDIFRLKSSEFKKYRIFYIVDEDSSIIYILEIIKRDDKTYNLSGKHINTIKDLYIEYYTKK